MSIISFTGGRAGPTQEDHDDFDKAVDDLAATLKKPSVLGYAVAYVVHEDGTDKSYSDFSKKPGLSLNELLGSVWHLGEDIRDYQDD